MTPVVEARDERPDRCRDEGSILVMSLILVVIFGMIVGSIAAFAGTSFRHTGVVRSLTEMRASSETGLRVTVDQLKRQQTLCADFSTGPVPLLGVDPNDASIEVECTNIGGANQGASSWALILTGIGAGSQGSSTASLISGGSAAAQWTRRIGGRIYMGTPHSHDVSNMELQGDLFHYHPTCDGATAPTIGGLSFTQPHGMICAPVTWNELVTSFLMPAFPTLVDPPGEDNLIDGKTCRVFRPGVYTEPPDLAKDPSGSGAGNYFASGDYYFAFDGALPIGNAGLLAGRPDPSLGEQIFLASEVSECVGAWNDDDVAGYERGYGATFFLGGGAWIDVEQNGTFEILRRMHGTQPMSIVAVPDTAGGYEASTRSLASTAGDRAILGVQEGGNNDIAVHGLIYAPKAQLRLGNVANEANAQIHGGAVVAGIYIAASNTKGLVISASSVPAQTKILMRSTATDPRDRSVTTQAVLDYEPSRLVADGATTNGLPFVTSVDANFTDDDIGSRIEGAGIPPADSAGIPTRIESVSGDTAEISVQSDGTSTNAVLTIHTPQVAINSWRKCDPGGC